MRKIILMFSIGLLMLARGIASAESSLESQVVAALAEESAKGPIKVGIIDFTFSTLGDVNISKEDTDKLKTQATESFETGLMKEIKIQGLKQKISLVERSRLLDILNEKKLSTTGLTEKTAASIGGIAGLDIIIFGSISMTHENLNAKAKLIRVKDATMLDVMEQTIARPKAPQEPQIILNETFKVSHNNIKDFAWDFQKPGTTLNILIKSDMVVNLYIFDDSNFKQYKAGQKANVVINKSNITSGNFIVKLPAAGTYYLAVQNQQELLLRADVSLTVSAQ